VDLGAVVGVAMLRFWVITLLIAGGTVAAQAEDLLMPYECRAGGGEVQISPANQTTYRILGSREEQPFVVCGSSAADCTTMMVHRFMVECDGTKVPWSRIANAARVVGVAMPAGLPTGFAPVSTMSGRFVLPSLTRTAAFVSRVTTQDLSPDSVIDRLDDTSPLNRNTWVTEVRADVWGSGSGGNAMRVGGSLAAVLAMLLAASMVAAGRWRLPTLQFATPLLSANGMFGWAKRLKVRAQEARDAVFAFVGRLSKAVDKGSSNNPTSTLYARLLAVELSVTALRSEQLLRDVLTVELDGIRKRTFDFERQGGRHSPEKAAVIVRILLRDLDRIARIAQTASLQPAAADKPSEIDMPHSTSDAYRVLGINGDAAPAVAKKLVDALRMSWHPDHARDDHDRVRREAKMKQINAAWDLIKDRRAAA
jgi:hypothetical protein